MADLTLQQLLAASALITTLERICSSGLLPESEERDLRELIVKSCRAFRIDTIAERPLNVVELRPDAEPFPVVESGAYS